MKVPRGVHDALISNGAELIVAKTGDAVAEYNRLLDKGRRIAAALHLTC
jgi:hypothetical protein